LKTFIVRLNKEPLLLVAYLTFSFLTLVKPGYNGFPIQLNDNFSYLLTLLFGFLLAFEASKKVSRQEFINHFSRSPYYIIFLIFVLLSFTVNTILGLYEIYTAVKTLSFFTIGILNFYLIPLRFRNSQNVESLWGKVILFLSVFVSAVAILGVFEFPMFFGWNSFDEKLPVIKMRSTASILFEPNIYALLLMFGIFFTHVSNYSKKIKITLMLVLILGLFFSYSRGAWLCMMIYVGFIFYHNSKFKKVLLILSILLAIVIIPVLFNIKEVFELLNLDNPLTGRLDLWKLTINKSLERPVTGIGMSSERLNELFLTIGKNYTTSHNVIIDSLLTNGWVATLFYILTFLTPLTRKGDKNTKNSYFKYFGITVLIFLLFSPHNIGGASLMAVSTALLFGKLSLHGK
jgi:O-antigen ligase